MNRVVHFEIHAADQDALQKFYQELFGWEFQDTGPSMGNYRLIMTGKTNDPADAGINGGLTKREGAPAGTPAPVNAFVCIVSVEDVDATVDKARGLGATVSLAPMDATGVGRLAYLMDPERNLFGIMKPLMRG